MVQRLGEYRKAMADRPGLEGMRIGHKTDAAALMKQIRPDLTLDQADTLRPGLSKTKNDPEPGQPTWGLARKH